MITFSSFSLIQRHPGPDNWLANGRSRNYKWRNDRLQSKDFGSEIYRHECSGNILGKGSWGLRARQETRQMLARKNLELEWALKSPKSKPSKSNWQRSCVGGVSVDSNPNRRCWLIYCYGGRQITMTDWYIRRGLHTPYRDGRNVESVIQMR